MAAAFSVVQSTFFYRTSHFLAGNGRRRRRKDGLVHFTLSSPFFSSSAYPLPSNRNWRQPAVSLLELGGVKISKEDVVRDDPTNNVPDTIFSKLGIQLHRRNQHPPGILKNSIYQYFDVNFPGKFDKFDDLCPLVSVKQELQ
uniref:PhenylalaninetRNA ligaseic/mitochondrial n=1 Tax=Rhizophora mucronata TaxID=61149 RepID=A0A2P2MBX9_RHIMU